MKNKKLLYGLLGIGAIAGFYFWNKNKMPKDLRSQREKNCANEGRAWDDVEKNCGMKL
jgi:gas vesicle protein